MQRSPLPRLLYVGDVPVENTWHGSVVLHRLLRAYPPDRLFIIEFRQHSSPSKRLAGVNYRYAGFRLERLLSTRLHKLAAAFFLHFPGTSMRKLVKATESAKVDAILTVAHGYSWIVAASIAKRRGLPLHVLVHDQIFGTYPNSRATHRLISGQFREVLNLATSVFSVSPMMKGYLKREFGRESEVLYPSQDPNSPIYRSTSPRVERLVGGPNVAYAGTFHGDGQLKAVAHFARALDLVGGRLHLFGQDPISSQLHARLPCKNIVFRGFVADLVEVCRCEMDALLVVNSFDPADLPEMEVNFPSKLAVYTALGLPIIILAPPRSSAMTWSRENPTAAAAIDQLTGHTIGACLRRFVSDAAWRCQLAAEAIRVGAEQFSPSETETKFFTSLKRR